MKERGGDEEKKGFRSGGWVIGRSGSKDPKKAVEMSRPRRVDSSQKGDVSSNP
jgi:hypothetical protein